MQWEGVRLHLISSMNQSGSVIYPNGGGINDQPDYFYEIITIIDKAVATFIKHKKVNDDFLKKMLK